MDEVQEESAELRDILVEICETLNIDHESAETFSSRLSDYIEESQVVSSSSDTKRKAGSVV
jgi:hypothetical protein